MVVKLSKVFGYILFFLLALMYFTPKVNLYYFLEKELSEKNIVIDDEQIIDNGFSLSVTDAKLNVKSIESATVEEINVKVFALYNSISLENIKLSSVAASMVPIDVSNVNITYTIFNPLYITADAVGGFGEAEINFSILDMALHLDLKPSKNMLSSHSSTLRNLKKSKEGDYSYDKIFKF